MKHALPLKILSVLIASFIWLQIILAEEQSVTFNIPLTLNNIPKDVSIEARKVPVTVKGKGLEIIRYWLTKPKAELDASFLSAGVDLIPPEKYQINKPHYLEVSVDPVNQEKLFFSTDEKIEKIVPVSPTFSDPDLESYFKPKLLLLPSEIKLTGPKSKLDRLRQISTNTINQRMLESSSFRIDLIKPDPNILISDSSVQVLIREIETSIRIYTLAIDSSMGKPYPAAVSVKLKGPSRVLADLKLSELKAFPDKPINDSGDYTIGVEVPSTVILIDKTPQVVQLNKNE